MHEAHTESTERVWDPLVRIFHWTLAAAFFTAWLSGDEWQSVHVIAGYTIAVLVIVRFFWGWVGPRNARFTGFVRGPRAVFRYLASLVGERPERHSGHNPAGGWMIVLLLIALSVQVSSGMMLYALEDGRGPLAAWVGAEASGNAGHENDARRAEHDEHEDESEEFWEELHEFGADALLMLVALHLAGVVVASLIHRENLVRSMVTGRRTVDRSRMED